MIDCSTCKHKDAGLDEAPCNTCTAVPGPGLRWEPMQAPATGTEAKVCADIARRQSLGIAKYGTTVADNPLVVREWLQHAYEECLDQAVYLRRAMDELDAKK